VRLDDNTLDEGAYLALVEAELIVRRTVVPGCDCGLPRSEYVGHWCDANGGRWTPWPTGGAR
jgi:hypothetical protein